MLAQPWKSDCLVRTVSLEVLVDFLRRSRRKLGLYSYVNYTMTRCSVLSLRGENSAKLVAKFASLYTGQYKVRHSSLACMCSLPDSLLQLLDPIKDLLQRGLHKVTSWMVWMPMQMLVLFLGICTLLLMLLRYTLPPSQGRNC
jgi:hypothetical protein